MLTARIGRRRSSYVEVALEGLAKSADFKLYVDGSEVIAFAANKAGKASLKFSSKNAKN